MPISLLSVLFEVVPVIRSASSPGFASAPAGRSAARRPRRVADVWPPLGLGDQPPGLLYAVNRSTPTARHALADGDEVALIPPVSGGAFRLTEEPLDPAAVIREVADPRAGGIATFIGTTRVQSRGRTVHYLDYEAYGGHGRTGDGRARRGAEARSTISARSRSRTGSAASTSASRRW